LKELQLELKDKNSSLDGMRRNMKVTKFQEMEQEKASLYDELKRLRHLIDGYEIE
jgi:hypothetical protein